MATATKTFLPTGYDTTRSTYYSISNPDNFVNCDTTSTTRTNIYLVRGSQAETFFYINFDFSEIPQDATITSISGKIKGKCTGNGNYISYRQFRPYVEDTARGYSKNFTASDQVLDIDFGTGTYTREQLNDLTIRLYAKRTSSGTTNSYYFQLYGAEITVTYTVQSIVHVTSVSLDLNSKTIEEEESFQLTETVLPDNATDSSVSWSTSSSSIATVSNGLVTGVSPGTATITVTTTDGGFTDTCNVTVTAVPKLFIKKNGSWVQVNKIYQKVNGSWTEVALDTLTTPQLYVKG